MDKRTSFFKRASDAEPQKRDNNNSNGYEQRVERRERDNRFEDRSERGDRGGGFSRDNRRDDRGGFNRRDDRRDDRGGFNRRDDRRNDFRKEREPRGDRGAFIVRPRMDDSQESEREFDRNEYRGDNRNEYRNEYRSERGGNNRNERRGERREFLDKDGNPKRMVGGKPLSEPKNLIFGVHPVNEALEAGRSIEKIYTVKRGNESLQAIEQLATEAGIPIQYVPTEKLDYLSKRNNHQGVVATIGEIEYADFSAVMDKNPTLVLILDGVTDVRNFGAIARTEIGRAHV